MDPQAQERLRRAFALAVDLHANQKRKGTSIPYVSHLMAVTAIVMEHGGNDDEGIAALLHDAVEDAGGQLTLQKIREAFGDVVANIVAGCTDADVIPKPPWRQRKETYIAHVASAPDSVRLVSAADKLHNVRSILADYRRLGPSLWGRFNGGRDGTIWYYRTLADALAKAGRTHLVGELDQAVSEIEREVADREGNR